MGEPRDIFDCRSHEELLALWRTRYERIREMHERANEDGLDLSRLTRPPRDPDERAFLERHGGLGPVTTEKPNPPWAKSWPPRNPNRPLTERETFADAVNAAWREEPLDDRSESDAVVPQTNTEPAVDGACAPATSAAAAGSGAAGGP